MLFETLLTSGVLLAASSSTVPNPTLVVCRTVKSTVTDQSGRDFTESANVCIDTRDGQYVMAPPLPAAAAEPSRYDECRPPMNWTLLQDDRLHPSEPQRCFDKVARRWVALEVPPVQQSLWRNSQSNIAHWRPEHRPKLAPTRYRAAYLSAGVKLFENEDFSIHDAASYVNLDGSNAHPLCYRSNGRGDYYKAGLTLLLKRSPDFRITLDWLWDEVRPAAFAAIDGKCTKDPGTVTVNVMYDGFKLTRYNGVVEPAFRESRIISARLVPPQDFWDFRSASDIFRWNGLEGRDNFYALEDSAAVIRLRFNRLEMIPRVVQEEMSERNTAAEVLGKKYYIPVGPADSGLLNYSRETFVPGTSDNIGLVDRGWTSLSKLSENVRTQNARAKQYWAQKEANEMFLLGTLLMAIDGAQRANMRIRCRNNYLQNKTFCDAFLGQ